MKLSTALFQFGRLSLTMGTCLAVGLAAVEVQARYQPRPSGIPTHRVSGGTRDPIPSCLVNPTDSEPLTALVPEYEIGTTTAAYPAFQWYLPANNASHLEFRLDEVDLDQDVFQPLYQTAFALSGKGGISSLQLPSGAGIPSLDVGKTYYWAVEVYCEADGDQADMLVEGWIARVDASSDLQSQLDSATTPVARAIVAAENHVWYDATQTLANQILAQPADSQAQQEWKLLLEAVDLDAIATEPFIQP